MSVARVTADIESPRTHVPPCFDSPPDPVSVRVKVYHAIMRSPPSCSSSSRSSAAPRATASLPSAKSQQSSASTSGARPKFLICGPRPDQVLELSDSSSGDSRDSGPSPSRTVPSSVTMYRSVSTSQLPDFSTTASSLRATKSSLELPTFGAEDEQATDWVEYAATDPDLDGHAAEGTSSSISDDGRDTGLLFSTTQRASRTKLDPQQVCRMLQECLDDEPPAQTEPHRQSTRPIPTMNVTAPNSPTVGVRAVNFRRARAVSACADDRAACSGSSDHDSVASVALVESSCHACGRQTSVGKWMRLEPCSHLACSTCFGAAIGAVSTSRTVTRCPSCFEPMISCYPADEIHLRPTPRPNFPRVQQMIHIPEPGVMRYPVLRIDNVAWDITPEIVRQYLPPNVLPLYHPQPIHIPIDRIDGRTKDFMYIEVANEEAARQILKLRQNSHMPGGPLTGGRKRPVTITSVPLSELVNEVGVIQQRLRSAELIPSFDLDPLRSCTAYSRSMTSFVAPSGLAHFIKSRHGPFYNVMSILTKLRGRDSPAYWDVFYLASGAIKALVMASAHVPYDYLTPYHDNTVIRQDQQILHQLSSLFHATFRNFDQA